MYWSLFASTVSWGYNFPITRLSDMYTLWFKYELSIFQCESKGIHNPLPQIIINLFFHWKMKLDKVGRSGSLVLSRGWPRGIGDPLPLTQPHLRNPTYMKYARHAKGICPKIFTSVNITYSVPPWNSLRSIGRFKKSFCGWIQKTRELTALRCKYWAVDELTHQQGTYIYTPASQHSRFRSQQKTN